MKKNNKKKVTKTPVAKSNPMPKKSKKISIESQVKTGLRKLLKNGSPKIREELIKIIQDTTYGGPAPITHEEAARQLDDIKQLVVRC